MRYPWWTTTLLLASIATVGAAEYPVRPYVDPDQLAVPWPKHSHYKQPWRAWMETRSADDFLRGIGINYNYNNPKGQELSLRLLAETGFRTMRIEVPWASVGWDESGLTDEPRLRQMLQFCRRNRIRPTFLLNAHHGVPGPVRFLTKELKLDAPKGSRSIVLTDLAGVVRGTGLSNLSGYWAAEALITNVVPFTGECTLSKPLPKDLKAGTKLSLATLKYLPIYPTGTPEFEATAAGWVRYAMLVTRLARDSGLSEFDVEIWNELTFGSRFLNIDNYYNPPIIKSTSSPYRPGGPCWELARRTIESIKRENPSVRCIWGFSNTTFFHTPAAELPPFTDGQSYHPYGTGTRRFPEQEYDRGKPNRNLEEFTPTTEMRSPEGWAHLFIQTESIMRLINPTTRQQRPSGTERFYHYMTEHGVGPPSADVKDDAGSWDLKAKTALRSFALWLHKGIDAMHFYSAYQDKASGMGILPPNLPQLPADAAFESVATPPMRAINRLTRAFAGSTPLATVQPLDVDVVALGEQGKNWEGDGAHPPLWHRDCFAFLPFQVNDSKHVVALYVVTWDATKPIAPQRYRLTIRGLATPPREIRLTDPLRDEEIPLQVVSRDAAGLVVETPVVDYPRLLTIAR